MPASFYNPAKCKIHRCNQTERNFGPSNNFVGSQLKGRHSASKGVYAFQGTFGTKANFLCNPHLKNEGAILKERRFAGRTVQDYLGMHDLNAAKVYSTLQQKTKIGIYLLIPPPSPRKLLLAKFDRTCDNFGRVTTSVSKT